MTPEDQATRNPPNFFRAVAISAAIILFWVIVFFVQVWQAGTPGTRIRGFISIRHSWQPSSPHWHMAGIQVTRPAQIIGALPFPLVIGGFRIISSTGQPAADVLYVIVYFLSLSLAGGLEGYFAAKKTTGYVLIALLFAGIWTGIFLSGIH